MQEHLIVIGGVAAGTKAAAKARRENSDLKITIYTDGYYISYSACALPYLIEGIIKDQNKLLVRSPETFKEKDNIDVYIRHRVTGILPHEKKVEVENLETGEKFQDEYTKLLIATGAKAFIPNIEGVNLKGVFTLRSFEDGVAIKNYVHNVKKAVIVGAGFIGLEMTEAFHNLGIGVTLVEFAKRILSPLDEGIAMQVQKYVEEKHNIKVITGDGAKRITGNDASKVIGVETNSGKFIEADIVLLSVGVKPNIEIAKEAGIEIGTTGAIKVNSRMQTTIPDIYAAGNCVEQISLVTGKPVWIPLGSTANKEGRVAAINITGGYEEFKGTLGSHVSKLFDYTLTRTGLCEREVKEAGYNYESIVLTSRDKSGYFPTVKEITIKMLVDRTTRKVLGAQIIGEGDADKRINIIATAITAGMTIDDIPHIDLTYAPPYSPAIDPVITAAQLLQKRLE